MKKSVRFTSFTFKNLNFAQILENFAWTCVCLSMRFKSSKGVGGVNPRQNALALPNDFEHF